MRKKALITGITGQDGSYLAELLVSLQYDVHGMVRRVAAEDQRQRLSRIADHVQGGSVTLHQGSLESYPSICRVVQDIRPDEVYHLAAQSFVAASFEDEFSTMNTNINGVHFVLDACRRYAPEARVYFAGSSEMFGKAERVPQDEETPLHPRSPYGISKVAGFHLARYYRERNDPPLFVSTGILFNHESQRRGMEFVTRKITHGAARIAHGKADRLELGNPDARRDWGYAPDYVRAMWLMLQQERPDDFVVATGETRTVREFAEAAFESAGLNPGKHIVWNNPADLRPAEVDLLVGNPAKAYRVLDWRPAYGFRQMVNIMVRSDWYLVAKEK
ncbi:MAG TPA: GDP-mannose 4,6-dehydratase [Candidatus Paceibacterota bacterium]|nr:GDP-mannose 4,6-dehydratase [Candidatus Paceibacterota bacterium]